MTPPATASSCTLRASGNRLGIVSMVMAMACFGINDALAKQISQQVPTFQLIFRQIPDELIEQLKNWTYVHIANYVLRVM